MSRTQTIFDPNDLTLDGLGIMYKTYMLTVQTLAFGVYAVLLPLSTHILLKRGFVRRVNVILLCAIFVPFIFSTAYWMISLAEQITRIRTCFVDRTLRDAPNITVYTRLFNALMFVNYIFGDGVVVWRAHSLCKHDYLKVLAIPKFSLILTTIFVFGTISIRIATFFTRAGPGASNSDPLIHALNVAQVATLIWSLLTNLSATLIISHKAWGHRQTIREGLKSARNRSTQAERVLALLIESGLAYLVSSVTLLVFMFIRLPSGTIGDIYTPVNIQIAGIYPTLVIVLVGLQKSMKETTFWHASEATAMRAANGNAVSQIRFDSARQPNESERPDHERNVDSQLEEELAYVKSSDRSPRGF